MRTFGTRPIGTLLVIVLASIVLLTSSAYTGAQSEPVQATVFFANPVNIATALSMATSHDLDILQYVLTRFASTAQGASETATYGHRFDPPYDGSISVLAITEDSWKMYGAILAAHQSEMQPTQSNLELAAAMVSQSAILQARMQEFAAIDGCWNGHTCPQLTTVTELEVTGTASAIQSVAGLSLVHHVEYWSNVDDPGPNSGTHRDNRVGANHDHEAHKEGGHSGGAVIFRDPDPQPWHAAPPVEYHNWAPTQIWGFISWFNTCANCERELRAHVGYMAWMTDESMLWLKDDDFSFNYEHEFYLNPWGTKYYQGTFLKDEHQFGMPAVVNWECNLPRCYLDNMAGNTAGWAFGSTDTENLQRGRPYRTMIITDAGNIHAQNWLDMDNGCVAPQLQHATDFSGGEFPCWGWPCSQATHSTLDTDGTSCARWEIDPIPYMINPPREGPHQWPANYHLPQVSGCEYQHGYNSCSQQTCALCF